MTKVIGVRFRTAGKIYFFSPGKLEIKTGDKVIVETARGVEFGSVVTGPKEVEDDKITQPLKYVWQQSGLPQIPIPPRIFVSSRTPICLNSILVRNTLARSFTSSRKSIRPSAVK